MSYYRSPMTASKTLLELLQSSPLDCSHIPASDGEDSPSPPTISSSVLVNESAANIMSERNFATCFLEQQNLFAYHGSSSSSHLKPLVDLHEGQQPLACDLCAYTTSYSYSMVIHKHAHSGDKPYKCGACDFSTAFNATFQQHARSHAGEEPYKCDNCDYKALCQFRLKHHRLVHTNPYKCRSCSFKSKQQGVLTRHELTQHLRTRPHKCSVCTTTSTGNCSL